MGILQIHPLKCTGAELHVLNDFPSHLRSLALIMLVVILVKDWLLIQVRNRAHVIIGMGQVSLSKEYDDK